MAFREGEGVSADPTNGFRFLSEAYRATAPDYIGRFRVPVLWDKKQARIVSNDDDHIMRMLNSEFDAFTDSPLNLHPESLRGEIDRVNGLVYPNVNDGVYRAGFATNQRAYEAAVTRLFEMLDELEDRLSVQRYLIGDRITEADWRLLTTLVRFDAVYYVHFKCNVRRIADYPSQGGYLRDLYYQPGVSETVNFDHIKRHYYFTHDDINPYRIVPVGPAQNLDAPHGRE